MREEQKLKWHWYSKKGASQLENRDSSGIFFGTDYTFAIIMDASNKGKNGVQFNTLWINEILKQLPLQSPSQQEIIQAMRAAHQALPRHEFLHERACYVALLLPHETHSSSAFVCGDCRIGIDLPTSEREWLTPVHTLANACQALDGIPRPISRHTVTRVLQVKRFEHPDVIELPIYKNGTWILATDGYWADPIHSEEQPDDDCSYLLLGKAIPLSNNAGPIIQGSY